MVDPSYFAPADIAGSYQKGAQFGEQQQEYRQKQEDRRRLADLLPQAAHGNQGAIDQIAGLNPELFMHLDDRQREQAKAEVSDLGAAVRWADTPEKWQYVQQHYGQKGIDLSQYQFQDRERGLVALGQIDSYLKDAPKPEYRTIEAGGSLIDVSGGNPRVVIAPNPGGHDVGTPYGGGSVPQQAADYLKSHPELAPQFDQKYGQGASQKILGGQTQPASGGFLGGPYPDVGPYHRY
jgi:hypothetical protein